MALFFLNQRKSQKFLFKRKKNNKEADFLRFKNCNPVTSENVHPWCWFVILFKPQYHTHFRHCRLCTKKSLLHGAPVGQGK